MDNPQGYENAPQQEESVLVIRFAAPNSTLMEVRYQNVSPLQAIAAAWVIQKEAEATIVAQRQQVEEQRQLGKIVVPGQNRGV